MNELLSILPNATGLITTPEIATLKHGKRATNPIIYNILTDRPTISSSLPVNLKKMPLLNTTIIKRGMEIRVYLSEDEFPEFTPGMHHRDDLSEESGEFGKPRGIDLLEFEKRGILDLKKLKHLIDDSFGRDLDMNHYLNRVNGNVAALIIAGDFEGGAVITWESSPVAKEGSNKRYVPYLDKFAVLRHLQGVPGLADIVFKSVLTSFPHELLWRSRITNPVNKWYFERSLGDFVVSCDKEDNTPEWRLFWSGSRIRDKEDFVTYDEICKSIEPSFHKK